MIDDNSEYRKEIEYREQLSRIRHDWCNSIGERLKLNQAETRRLYIHTENLIANIKKLDEEKQKGCLNGIK